MEFISNLNDVLLQIDERLKNIDTEKMTREQATTIMGLMRERIHSNGKSSNDSQIGTYSKGYLVVRSGAFQNAPKRKVKKGATSRANYGKYTKGNNIGDSRVKYNRGSDSKVILSLTRQMESDYLIVPVDNGYGVGFSNSENYNKAINNEKRYKKEIFSMTKEEERIAIEIAERYISEI